MTLCRTAADRLALVAEIVVGGVGALGEQPCRVEPAEVEQGVAEVEQNRSDAVVLAAHTAGQYSLPACLPEEQSALPAYGRIWKVDSG
jgi:hypothetical protein